MLTRAAARVVGRHSSTAPEHKAHKASKFYWTATAAGSDSDPHAVDARAHLLHQRGLTA